MPRTFVKATGTKTYKVPNPAPATQEWLGMYKETEYPEILGWGREGEGNKPMNYTCSVQEDHRAAASLCFPTKLFFFSSHLGVFDTKQQAEFKVQVY